jgi:hypothetical protein
MGISVPHSAQDKIKFALQFKQKFASSGFLVSHNGHIIDDSKHPYCLMSDDDPFTNEYG